MTEEGLERENRRRTRSAFGVLGLLGLSGALAARTQSLLPFLGLVAVLFLMWCGFAFFVWRDGRAELRRRAAGAAPSWPAQLPAQVAELLGAKAAGHGRRADEVGEFLGRLSLVDSGLRWEPRDGDHKRGVGPLVFDRSWSAEVVPLWGPGSQGCLTLTHPDGTAVDVWIRHPGDLRRALGS